MKVICKYCGDEYVPVDNKKFDIKRAEEFGCFNCKNDRFWITN